MRRTPIGLAAAVVSASFAFAACSLETQEELPTLDGPVEVEAGEQIFGGTADTTTDAVVALISQSLGAGCTGTIVSASGDYGYVLTAAHCESMDTVILEDDYEVCFTQAGCDAYEVVGQAAHPNWTGDPIDRYDFRMLRFYKGATSVPTIPYPTGNDGVVANSTIRLVGYGKTTINDNGNTQRRTVEVLVDELDGTLITYDQTNGDGACQGDSGGPAIQGGMVVGVTSFGDPDCAVYGASGRVSAVSSWITGFINGTVEEATCDQCFNGAVNGGGACGSTVDACFGDGTTPCAALVDCFNNCGNGDNTCIEQCASANQAGIDPYNAILDCACNACASECAAECGTPSTSSTGTGATTSTGTGAGAGGGAGSDDGGSNDGDDDGGGTTTTVTKCDCTAVGAPAGSIDGALVLGGLGLAASAIARRKRRRG